MPNEIFVCDECDNEVKRGDGYCSNCGNKLAWPSETDTSKANINIDADPEAETNTRVLDRAKNNDQLTDEQIKALKLDARIRAILWFSVFISGIIATAVSYDNATKSSSNGTYFIFWGAILFGLIKGTYWACRAVEPESYIKKK